MNILVIMLDSLRPDQVGAYGNSEVKTPHIDALAQDGLTFDSAYAEYPITIPARTALVSGCYTFTNRPWCPLRSYDMHIAEELRKAGFTTSAFSDSPFRASMSMERGFSTFEWLAVGKCQKPVPEGREYDISHAYFPPNSEGEKRFYRSTMINREYALETFGKACPELLFDAAIEWLDHHGKEQFFLWIDSFEPHEPWCPTSPYAKMYQPDYQGRYIPMPRGPSSDWMTPEEIQHVLALYKGDITHTDEQVGKVVAKLRELGAFDDTLIVIVSDHGEPFAEHRTIRKFGVPVYDELARIVFIMSGPGIAGKGRHAQSIVSNVDFAPTILDMIGLKPPPRQGINTFMRHGVEKSLDGESLLPILNGGAESLHDEIFMGGFCLRGAIRTQQWKFIDNRGEKPNELFDMRADSQEKNNLVEKEPNLIKELHRKLWDFESQWSASLSWRDEPAK